MKLSRRAFVTSAGAAAAAMALPAAQNEPTLKVGLVGCGGRGTGAAENCMKSAPNVQLIALGDMFPERITRAQRHLGALELPGYKVNANFCFSGFDAYKRVLDSGVDLVLLATPPGFRPMHFEEAIAAGKHVFMEKPVAVDPAGVRKVIAIGEKAKQKKLGVVSGTQYRHQVSFIETVKRVHAGQIGRVVAGRAYYNGGTLWSVDRREGMSDMEWQVRNWYYFDWLSGDHIVEQHVHTIDATDWVMGARPVRAVAVGGRQVRTDPLYGNIYDHFCVDYEYPGGVHVMSMTRQMAGCDNLVGAFFTGTKGNADIYNAEITGESPWKFPEKPSIGKAYVQEHTDLIESIRAGTPINEAEQVALSSLTAIMGREAAYTGKVVEWNDLARSDQDLSPPKYEFGPLPVRPVPMPGKRR